jgi:hypothetical protein
VRGLWLTSHVLADPRAPPPRVRPRRSATTCNAAPRSGRPARRDLAAPGAALLLRAAAAHGAFGPAASTAGSPSARISRAPSRAVATPPARSSRRPRRSSSRRPRHRGRVGAARAAPLGDVAADGVGVPRALARHPARGGPEARLDAWVAAGLGLHEARAARRWRRRGSSARGAAAGARTSHYALLADVVRALTTAVGDGSSSRSRRRPRPLHTSRARDAAARAAHARHRGAPAAHAAWRALPAALARLAPEVRAALVRVVAHLGPRAAAPLAETAPVVGALVGAVPAAERVPSCGSSRSGGALPRGDGRRPPRAAAALRDRRPDVVRACSRPGSASPRAADAAAAYFALESRTACARSRLPRRPRPSRTPRRLDEARADGERHAGDGAPVRGLTLRPPLEDEPARDEVALPMRVDAFPTYEENARLFRLLAAQVAGRRAFGTYADPAVIARCVSPSARRSGALLPARRGRARPARLGRPTRASPPTGARSARGC